MPFEPTSGPVPRAMTVFVLVVGSAAFSLTSTFVTGLPMALGLALLAPVGLALLGRMTGARDGALAALNAAFFRRARMENVSACLLLGAGLFLRAALPGGEKRA